MHRLFDYTVLKWKNAQNVKISLFEIIIWIFDSMKLKILHFRIEQCIVSLLIKELLWSY